ncbi:MAG TPA: hypothetical protein VGC40_09110 [Paenirhodobacter sp.]
MRRVDLAVGSCAATVLEFEGAVQLIWHRGPPEAPLSGALFNDFTSPGMGDQLRALADAVDAATAERDAR